MILPVNGWMKRRSLFSQILGRRLNMPIHGRTGGRSIFSFYGSEYFSMLCQ